MSIEIEFTTWVENNMKSSYDPSFYLDGVDVLKSAIRRLEEYRQPVNWTNIELESRNHPFVRSASLSPQILASIDGTLFKLWQDFELFTQEQKLSLIFPKLHKKNQLVSGFSLKNLVEEEQTLFPWFNGLVLGLLVLLGTKVYWTWVNFSELTQGMSPLLIQLQMCLFVGKLLMLLWGICFLIFLQGQVLNKEDLKND